MESIYNVQTPIFTPGASTLPRDHFPHQSGSQITPWSIIQLKMLQNGILMLNYNNLAQNDKVEKSQKLI